MLILILFGLLASFTTLCFSLSDLLSQRILIILNFIKFYIPCIFMYINNRAYILFFIYLLETYWSYLLKFISYFTFFCELSKRLGRAVFGKEQTDKGVKGFIDMMLDNFFRWASKWLFQEQNLLNIRINMCKQFKDVYLISKLSVWLHRKHLQNNEWKNMSCYG